MSVFSLIVGAILAVSLATNVVAAYAIVGMIKLSRTDLADLMTRLFGGVSALRGGAVSFDREGRATIHRGVLGAGAHSLCVGETIDYRNGCGDAAGVFIAHSAGHVAVVMYNDDRRLHHAFSADAADAWAIEVKKSAEKARGAGA